MTKHIRRDGARPRLDALQAAGLKLQPARELAALERARTLGRPLNGAQRAALARLAAQVRT